MLTVIIYQHNCKINEKVTGTSSVPLPLLKASTNEIPKESFGVVRKNDSMGSESDAGWITCKLNMMESGIDLSINQIILSEEVAELITIPQLVLLLQSACNIVNMADFMKKLTSNSPIFNPLLIPLISSVNGVILNSRQAQSSLLEHEKRLNGIIDACKLQLHPVAGDGNCFFAAVAIALKMNEQFLIKHDPNFFASKNLEVDDVNKLCMMLRKLTVDEWRNNEDDYKSFLTSSTVAKEADKFVPSGYYHGELGDTMGLALSNALQLVITVLSSIDDHPVIEILPRHVAAPVALFLAYNQFGPGHYDGLSTKVESAHISPPMEINTSCCTCGKSDKKNTHCHPKTRRYSTVCFCPCYNSKKGCSPQCKCKSCDNPLGKHVNESPSARKRPRHNWQIPTPHSATFAIQAGESLNCGSRSLLEFFTMEEILRHCIRREIPTTSDNITIIYNAIVEVSTHEMNLPLGAMTVDKISTFLREYEHNRKLFQAQCITHLQLEYQKKINNLNNNFEKLYQL